VLPRPPLEVAASQVLALIGTNRDEARLFLVPGGTIDAIDAAMLQDFAATYGITDLSAFPGATPAEVMLEVYTYARFARPAAQLVEARSEVPTWTYSFDGLALDDNGGLGSCHTAEVPFVFETAHLPELRRRRRRSGFGDYLVDLGC
jgi:para-nitrobenzyl esterase